MTRRFLLEVSGVRLEGAYCEVCEHMARLGFADEPGLRVLDCLAEECGERCNGCDDAFEEEDSLCG